MNPNFEVIEQEIYEDQNEATPLINTSNNVCMPIYEFRIKHLQLIFFYIKQLALSTSSVLSSLYRIGRLRLASSFDDLNENDNIFSILENDTTNNEINIPSQFNNSICNLANNNDNNNNNNNNFNQSIIVNESESNNQNTINIIVDNKIQQAQLQERINKEYPIKFIVFNSIILFIFNLAMIIAERTQPDSFTFGDVTVISYRTLDGLILFASIINLIYFGLAIFSSNLPIIFLT
jgi:hypothetical protein